MTKLELLENHREDPHALHNYIEQHYLQLGSFELILSRKDLDRVDETFDKIIQKHGILDSNFVYTFVDEDKSR